MANLLTTAGKGIWTAAVAGLGATSPKYLGWGTGAGGTAGMTDLVTPAAESRTTGTISQSTTSVTNDSVLVTGTITVSGSGKTISEVATFNASTSGTIATYATFTGIALNVGDSIAFSLTTQLS